MTTLNSTNVIEELEAVAESKIWKAFSLPSSKRIVVAPEDGFETLQVLLRDSEFINLLKEAIQDVNQGNIVTIEDDFFKAEH